MNLGEAAQLLAVGGSVAAMLYGMRLISQRLTAKEQGFGPNSLKALGVVLFVPSLVILAVTVQGFKTEVLAALLGTVAGYVLSHSRSDDK